MDNDISCTKKDYGTKKKTPFQLQTLEKHYSDDQYPTHKAMEEYAASLNLTYKQIRTWFVERRRKERRENEVHGCNKGLLGGNNKCGSIRAAKKMNVNTDLGERRPETMISSKYKLYNKTMNQESDQSVDSVLYAGSGSCRKNKKQPISKKKSLVNHGLMRHDTSSKHHHPLNPKLTVFQKKWSAVSNYNQHISQKNHRIRLQVLFSKDYILKRVFRKDGPPLGVEFDYLPSSYSFHTDSGILHSRRDSQRVPKRRKILCSSIGEHGNLQLQNDISKKYGIGKGLMTVWRATNPNNVKCPAKINIIDEDAVCVPLKSSVRETLCRTSKGRQQLKQKQRICKRKFKDKRRPLIKRGKVSCSKIVNQKKPHWTTCKLLIEELITEQVNASAQLADDEELELRELQAGPNPLRCSVHFASDGRHDCPLCKDLLARFPPQTVKMKQPFGTRPWDTSLELVKKLMKVLQFFYSNAATIEICPFTLDELAHAFTDKDSMLLGKIHVALLKLLLLDVQREVVAGSIPRASKNGRFLGFLHFVREQEIDVNIWSQSLNPLTWAEILRQVLVAAGFGSNSNTTRREIFNKERNQMAKYGLRPRTLKGELFTILSDQGSGGLKVSELIKTPQIVALDLPNTKEEIEQLICLTLSSDITLFEKIAPAAYRLRINPDIKGKEDYQLNIENSGSVDDDSGGSSSSSDESDGSEELNSVRRGQKIIKYKQQRKMTAEKVTESEIDESYSGEACVLGLMEGEYSDLSIDEKLDALTALIELTGACSSLKAVEPARAIPETVRSMRYRGSGAKIKKSLMDQHLMSQYSEIVSEVSNKGQSSATMSTTAKDKSGHDVHPMQSIYLGSDRRYNNYWLFLGPCDIIDPGHRQVYFESSEDGHWEVINTAQALDTLLSALDCRGTREARLFASLDKREAFLCQAMDDFMTTEYISRQTRGYCPSDSYNNSGDGSSPISDVDNVQDFVVSMESHSAVSGAVALELGKNRKEKKQKWDRLQAFDKWVWSGFYSELNVVKRSKRSYAESFAKCDSCHDLYRRDEKHCRICHTTFELDFDLEEKYAIHLATCRVTENSCDFPKHKVRPSQLQVLKAASHVIEAGMPESALSDTWTKSAHKLWVKRLQRTSSLPEFLQVLSDFVGAINEEWLYECASALDANAALDEIVVYFQTMPQTTSAVALWMVKLDTLVAPQLEKVQSKQAAENRRRAKRRRASTT